MLEGSVFRALFLLIELKEVSHKPYKRYLRLSSNIFLDGSTYGYFRSGHYN